MRCVLELAEQAGDDERRLLADVDRIVTDALDAPPYEHHVHAPLAQVGVVPDLQGAAEDIAVEPVDLVVLANQVLGHLDVALFEGLAALDHLLPRLQAHPLNEVEQL
jgi:hypothetical protein